MSLDRTKLEKVRDLANGGQQARCPACAEVGQDRKGEHLRISADGKFGCCVFPSDREHRRRIFALAGNHQPTAIKVRVASARTADAVQLDLLVRLGRVFGSPAKAEDSSPDNSGTLGTGFLNPRAYADNDDLYIRKLIGSDEPVPSVPVLAARGKVPDQGDVRLPYLTPSGDLVIPFNSPERYHWWVGGQSIDATRQEILERKENDAAPF